MTADVLSVKAEISSSEASTVKKIDRRINTLSTKLGARMDRTESDLAKLATSIEETRRDVENLGTRTSAEQLTATIGELVDKKLAAVRDPSGARPRPLGGVGGRVEEREERYLAARKQLKIWPIDPEDPESAAVDFLVDRLLMTRARATQLISDVHTLTGKPDSDEKNPAVVSFKTIAERDEVKSRAKNLAGSGKDVGMQMVVPDHLKSQYVAFQSLAYCMKKKNPELRRNVKFDDLAMELSMDVKISQDEGWKTITFETAKGTLRKRKQKTDNLTGTQLGGLLNKSDFDQDELSDSSVEEVSPDNQEPLNTDDNKFSCHSLSFINTNARSLCPKIQSLADCFFEKDLDFAVLTETWLQAGESNDMVVELADRHSLGLITRNRTRAARNGRQYGGVAFAYRSSRAHFEEFVITNPRDFEVLATVGKIKGIVGQVFCLSCYAPPNMTSADASDLLVFVSDLVSEAKSSFENCSVIVSGDFNQWPAQEISEEHADLREMEHGATRKGRKIDRSFANFARSVKETRILRPLETEDGRVSDHDIVYVRAEFLREKDEIITYTYRPYTNEGAEKFLEEIARVDWSAVFMAGTTTSKVLEMQKTLDHLMNACFPMKTTTRRAEDPPWMNARIRKMIKQRRSIYDREGRSKAWRTLKRKSDRLYKKRARKYMETQKRVLTSGDASRSFYKNVKAYQSREKPPNFDVRDLYPGLRDPEVAEELASHFNSISNEFEGLSSPIPTTYSSPLPLLTSQQVQKRLQDFRKPKSMVRGDIFPALVNRSSQYLAIPLVDIYNNITLTGEWPESWKTEYVTPIPKKNLPEEANNLWNISCTQLLSKVYESFVLAWLSEQTSLRSNQYGGVKGSGTEHFLVELWQKVLENLDDQRSASMLTSIDYSKAFNRLDFNHCLRALATKGTSTELLRIVASFLSRRTMTVKVGDALSVLRTVLGGVPQGSLLGVFLFNSSIDFFEASSNDIPDYNTGPSNMPTAPDPPHDIPVPAPGPARDYKHMPPFVNELIQVLKYIDDNILHEKINMDLVPTDGHSFRNVHAIRSQNLFRRIVHQAEWCGMKVNGKKTNVLCISELKSYIPNVYFYDKDGTKISSKESLKILGVVFSDQPDMSAHVEEIKRKFRSRKWIIHHLTHRGFSRSDLLKVYRSVILPCHDYCSNVYNSSLTAAQSNSLERLQAQVLKSIYGYEHSYGSLLQRTGLTTLKARRDQRALRFASKCANNPRFQHWFPKQVAARELRKRPQYKEFRARTTRLFNSPLYSMRRQLNNASGG